jgi:hypothetical protein
MAIKTLTNLLKILFLLKTSPIDGFPTPPDTGEAGRRRENLSMGEAELEAAA